MDRDLLRALDHLSRGSIELTVYRHTSLAYQPLSGDAARRSGGRWNPPASFPVVYTATDVATVDRELARSARRAGLSIHKMSPRRLATIAVRLTRVLDLTQREVLDALGSSTAALIDEDPTLSQRIGEAAHHLGYEAILAPSATGNGIVLAIFMDNRASTSVVELVHVRDDHIPTE